LRYPARASGDPPSLTGFEDSNFFANADSSSKAADHRMGLSNISKNLSLIGNGSNSDSVPATVPARVVSSPLDSNIAGQRPPE
jgi:hypothetical protein